MRLSSIAALALCATTASAQIDPVPAQDAAARNESVLQHHILPGFAALTRATGALAEAEACDRRDEWAAAVEAWVRVSHLRFGPTEADSRAFALAFWPDPRSATPSALASHLDDIGAGTPPDLAEASVAGRGLYALEFLLFDPAYADAPARCALIAALSVDAHATAKAIEGDWQDRYAALVTDTPNDTYRTDAEVTQQFLGALVTGLQFASDTRIGRPMGTFDRPRARRAEMWRSARSLANVEASLHALHDLAGRLSGEPIAPLDAAFARAFARAFERAGEVAQRDGGADFSLVDNPAGRFALELLQQQIDAVRRSVEMDLGPQLGVAAGFNALDGD